MRLEFGSNKSQEGSDCYEDSSNKFREYLSPSFDLLDTKTSYFPFMLQVPQVL